MTATDLNKLRRHVDAMAASMRALEPVRVCDTGEAILAELQRHIQLAMIYAACRMTRAQRARGGKGKPKYEQADLDWLLGALRARVAVTP
jgi:hypothetical protein